MERYEEIERGIKEGDIKGLRQAIGTLIYTDRDFSDGVFDEAVQYVEGKGIKLKDDTLVGKPVISSIKDTYTDDDLARAIFELKRNFCDERIEDVKIICRALYGEAEKTVSPQETPTPSASQKVSSSSTEEPSTSSKKKLIGAVAIVAALILLLIKLLK